MAGEKEGKEKSKGDRNLWTKRRSTSGLLFGVHLHQNWSTEEVFMKSTASCIASVAFLLAGILLAQEPPKESSNVKSQQETTLTGCLNKGSSQGQYVLTDQKTGDKTPVNGTSDLEQHSANHTVKLTGNRTTEGGRPVFTATKVEHLSATCSASDGDKK